MKKVLFWISFIISLMVLNVVPSFAMDFTVSPEMIGGLGDLGYGLLGGASFDFSGTEYAIDGYDNLSEQLKAEAANRKAREFIQAYCISRGIPIPNISAGGDLPASDLEGFYKSNYFSSSVRTNWNNYKLATTITDQEAALRFPIGPQSFADWSEYNSFWYDKYIDQFYTDDIIEVNPDPNYLTYIDKINGSGFWFKDFEEISLRIGAGYNLRALTFPFYNYSWTSVNTGGSYIYDFNSIIVDGDNILTVPVDGILDININTVSENTYNVSSFWQRIINAGKYEWNGGFFNGFYFYPNQSNMWADRGFSQVATSINYSGTLQQCLIFISNNFRNVNIYVDGIAWSLAGAPANPLIPTFPDVIGGTDDDPYPAYDIVFPNTSDYEGNFDLTSLFDAIKVAIVGASDNDNTTSGTLTRDKVADTFKDKTGEAVGEATKTIDSVLDDSFPIQGTLNYPILPPIPQIPIDNAFSGTTILAQLIDACQQILPEPLVLVFWGIIFILFIIGLIKILHK